MLSYQNVAQNEYQKEKDIPSPSPLTRPKNNNTNQQPTPVPSKSLIILIYISIVYILRKWKMINNHQSFRSNYNMNQINPQEQMLLEKQQLLMEEGEDLKKHNYYYLEHILPSNPLDNRNQKSIEQDLEAKFDYQEEMIIKLKSEVRRKQEAQLEKLQKKLEDYNILSS
ncbi:unnamed protein product [Paramecium primaurelia]|uniref:Transmembrane protein n=1 Tax=Paramecium primaurelia TaxID=5886 RepID=A0A8S1PMP9_PARPR|nr:unnamed protein product [Paramecium primaurelia]